MSNKESFYSALFGLNFKRWLILIVLCLVISVMLFPNIFSPSITYKIGDIAEADIKASYDFLIEDEALSAKNREEAGNSVPYVYDFDPSASNLDIRMNEVMSEARDFISRVTTAESALVVEGMDYPDDAEERSLLKERFFRVLEIQPDDAVFKKLFDLGFSDEIRIVINELITPILVKGVVVDKKVIVDQAQKGIILQSIQSQEETLVIDADQFYDTKAAEKYIKVQKDIIKKKVDTPQIIDLSAELVTAIIKPNVTFNKRETELRKELARESAKPFYYKIKKGEMLVREGERIEYDHLVKLSAEISSIGQPDLLGRGPGMVILLGFLFIVVYMAGMMKSRYYSDGIRYLLFNVIVLIGVFVVFWAYDFVAEEIARGFHFLTPKALLFAAPVACGAILITIFQGIGIAATFSLLISVLAALVMEGRVEFFIYFFVGSLLASYGVRGYRERGVLIKTGLKVGLANIALVFSIEIMHGSMYSLDATISLMAGFLGGILVGVISTGIVPLIEMAFGFTTDIKLLELANLDQPLLRELMVQAPGTYHHSVIVSNMVEASAEAIQANPLLAKVSSYYHDIGKMKKPLYFIENQMGGENRHEKLAPSMSSLVLISHVKDGVELAREHKLGREIIDIIQQHQGKSLISYFYQKAKEQAGNKASKSPRVKEDDFRYPGPKPQTKEAGLVMLADMAEAASRSLAEPNQARIQGVVQKIINKAFSDGQLDECELTLKDLHEIAKSFNKTLSGIFHQRVEYPEPNTKTSRKAANGDTDQFGSEDSRVQKKMLLGMMTKVLKDLDCNDRELSVLFTDNDYIADLNKQYRGKEGPTNVLAFPMSGGEPSDVESGMLGDVVVSVDTAITESLDIGESITTTICRLLIHGILHLLGFDHERSSEDEEIMQKEEKRLFALIQED